MRTIPSLSVLGTEQQSADALPRALNLAHNQGPHTSRGGRIFGGFAPCSANRTIRTVMAKIGHMDGPEFSSRGFRRVATQEIKDSGPTRPVVIQSGKWTHAGYRAYMGLQADYAINISSFILDTIGSDSDDDEDQTQTKTKSK